MLLSPGREDAAEDHRLGFLEARAGRAAVGRSLWVMVSPIRASLSFLIPAMR